MTQITLEASEQPAHGPVGQLFTPGDPVIMLSPPRSFSTVVCAMLGQHPQLYGLPETQLFVAETMGGWWEACSRATFPMTHGLLRAVAELVFGAQTELQVAHAAGWLRRRWTVSTGLVFEALAARAAPRRLVEKSPSIVYQVESMRRAQQMFPHARFIHLTRHPRGHGESVMKHIRESSKDGPVPRWLLDLAADGSPAVTPHPLTIDPQRAWLRLNRNIADFLADVPPERQMRVRGEDVLRDPQGTLGEIAGWIGVRQDAAAIEEMLHPERSPYARFGPAGAMYGNDVFFLQSPALRPDRARPHSLDGPLSWRQDGQGFLPDVRALAREFGYD